MRLGSLSAIVGLLLALTTSVECAKFDFVGKILPPLTQISRRHGMFGPDDAPASGSPGNGEAYINLDVSFRRMSPSREAFVQAIIFHNEELENVHQAANSGRFCMTSSTSQGYGFYLPDQTFVSTYQPLYKIEVQLPANNSQVFLRGKYEIKKAGLHYLMYSSCDPEAGNVYINGHNAWMNPYGYLSGELYYNMPFFLVLVLVNVLAIVIWSLLLAKHWEDVLPVQGHIMGVIVLSLLEAILWYSEYVRFNEIGTKPMPLLVAAIIVGTIKKTVSRLLVLVVCMGYGIVSPNLGSNACKVMAFGCVYCVFSAVLDVVKALSHDNDVSGGFFILVIIPVAILDSIFYLWTFMSLYDVVAQLEQRRQTEKLQLYRRFIWVLGTCLALSCGWVVYQMYFLYDNLFPSLWQLAWMFDAYWYSLAFAILVAIMYLWAPNENSKKYAYYEQNVNLEDGEDGMELESQENGLAPAFSIDDEDEEESPLGSRAASPGAPMADPLQDLSEL